MKYFSIALLLIFAVALSVNLFSQTGNVEEQGAVEGGHTEDIQGNDTEDSLEKRLEDRNMVLMGYVDPKDGENYTFVRTPDSCPFLKEGELAYTVTGAQVITNINDLPDGTLFDNDAVITEEDGSVGGYIHPYPPEDGDTTGYAGDFVLEDGSFIPGVYMVTLDITFENRGAANFVIGEDEGFAFYSDPYLFWIKDFLILQDMGRDSLPASNAASIQATFYSDFGKYNASGSNMYNEAVRVEPGETREITLGYTITANSNHLPEPEDLYAKSFYENAGEDELANYSCSVYLGLERRENK